MRNALFLAWRHVAHHRGRAAILVICLSITLFLPLAVQVLVAHHHRVLVRRAEETPLVVGAPGSPRDLVFSALTFKGRLEPRLRMAHVTAILEGGLAAPVPLHLRHSAGGRPLVGTSVDYFHFRGLRPREGSLPQVLGDVVLGAAAAADLGLRPGDRLLSDQAKLYDITSGAPLLMRVTGVLEAAGTADDLAAFCDVRTSWIIDGLGHGHADVRRLADPTMFTAAGDGHVSVTGALVPHAEVTPESLGAFHFHGDPGQFPLTAVLAFPRDPKSGTILRARYRLAEDAQAAAPIEVVEEVMDIVFRVKRFFDANFALVLASSALFLVLVMTLSVRLRRREFETLFKIGCSRATVLALQGAEVGLLLAASLTLAAALTAGLVTIAIRFQVLL